MSFKQIFDSAFMSSSSMTCFDKRCINLYANQVVNLCPYEVTEIDLELMFDISLTGAVLKIINHFNNNPWQVIDKFIYQKDKKFGLRANIISSYFHTFTPGDILCHAQFQSAERVYDYLKST
jgi:hypothetical protein